ncbi:hypothetical protein G6F32_016361 [Rhizopus arrhizus]|nr:hypothetical protein G6F32_016361 [Rhizopus arrhizus]
MRRRSPAARPSADVQARRSHAVQPRPTAHPAAARPAAKAPTTSATCRRPAPMAADHGPRSGNRCCPDACRRYRSTAQTHAAAP